MKLACILLSLFALLVLAAACPDILSAARNWCGRIRIGRMDRQDAGKAIRKVALRQLKKTPAVPLTDRTRFTLPERLRGAYKSAKVQSWQQAALLLGVAESGETQAVQAFRAQVLTPDGDWKQIPQSTDTAFLAYALLRTADDPAKIRKAMDAMYMLLSETAFGGTVPYTLRAPQTRFVDAVGMVCPFLYLYAKTYGCPAAETLCMAQLSEYNEKGLHPALHLPVHAFRQTDGAPLGIYGWGRGCGWYALALAELMRCGADVQNIAAPFAQAVSAAQQKNGAFSRQLLSETGIDSSATAMLGHFLYTFASYDPACKAAAERSLNALLSVVRRDGTVDMAQGDTMGIGFYSKRLEPMPAAQGFALLLAEEIR